MASFVSDLFSIESRVALVTGATSGIGRHAAVTLARAGASVVLVGRRRERLDDAVSSINRDGGEASAITADLYEKDELERVCSEASQPFGSPTIIVNAAGVNLRQSPDDITWASWDATLSLNLAIPFFLTRAFVPGMRDAGSGNVINIASLQSYRAFRNGLAYGASKGGIVQLTRAMAETWSKDGISINAIAPGFFPTELTAAVFDDDETSTHHAKMTAVGRNGELSDLDGAIVFLASSASAYVTGQVLPVDGGYTAK